MRTLVFGEPRELFKFLSAHRMASMGRAPQEFNIARIGSSVSRMTGSGSPAATSASVISTSTGKSSIARMARGGETQNQEADRVRQAHDPVVQPAEQGREREQQRGEVEKGHEGSPFFLR
jgi:hypothetical protein